MIEERI